MNCGQLKMQEDAVALKRRQLREEQIQKAEKSGETNPLDNITQLDGQFDTNDNEEEDEEMEIITNTDQYTTSIFNPVLSSDDGNYTSELLLSLSWDDVLYTSLMPLLSMEDMFRLRGTSTGFRVMVDGYFAQLKTLDLSSIGSRFTTKAFKVSLDNVHD